MAMQDEARGRMERDGYVVLEGVLDPVTEYGPVVAEFQTVLDGVAEGLHAQGLVQHTYRELPFTDRLLALVQASERTFSQFFDISLPKGAGASDTPMHLGPAAFRLLRNDLLLDVVEEFVGPEIYSNPVQHVRMKLPLKVLHDDAFGDGLAETVPWHQDQGVVLPEADDTPTLTVWIPLTEATEENGCLQVVPGSHRRGLVEHCPGTPGRAGGIPEKALGEVPPVPLPMRPGSVLLMHRNTMHGSLSNTTERDVRISFDLRYHAIGQPTGRPDFPGFVARSRTRPEDELRDPGRWAQSWLDARRTLARNPRTGRTSRWSGDTPLCA